MNKQLCLPANRLFNNSNLVTPGGTAELYVTGTLTPAQFKDENGADAGHVLTANGLGQLPNAWQDEATPFRLILKDGDGAEIDGGDIDPFYFGLVAGVDGAPGSGSDTAVASRSALAGASNAIANRYLHESGREGTFVWSDDDHSAHVTADTAQGIYVAPSSDTTGASGAWVRKFSGAVNPMWFGHVDGSAAGANGTANSTARDAMLATLKARAANVGTNYQGLEPVEYPAGYFEFDDSIIITDGTIIISGAGGSKFGAGTKFKFPAGVTGIIVERFNTEGSVDSSSPAHRGGDGSIIRRLVLEGSYGGTEAEVHGLHLRGIATAEDLYISDFEGDGVYALTSTGGTPDGLSNNSRMIRVTCEGNRRGFFVDGSDANVWLFEACIANSNRWRGFDDSSFLGNGYFNCHAASNGLVSGTTPTVVTSSSKRYGVIAGQETGASTNAPSGDTSDNTYWYYIGSGGVSSGNNIAAWVSGTTYRSGGSFFSDNNSAKNVYSANYHETGQGQAQFVAPSIVISGTLSGNVWAGSTASVLTAGTSPIGLTCVRPFVTKPYTGTDEVFTVQLGDSSSSVKPALKVTGTVNAASAWRFFELQTGGDIFLASYANSGTYRTAKLTGPSTSEQFGTGAAVVGAFACTNFRVGPSYTNARLLTNGTAAPGSGTFAQGAFQLNRSPSTAGIFAWNCTTAGTPGTWQALYAMTDAQQSAWTAWTGTASRATKDTSTATLADVAAAVKTLIDDLKARGVLA